MYRDLSVVLQAVERGLARPAQPEPEPEPEPEPLPVVPRYEPEVAATAVREPVPLPGQPRVEVLPSRSRFGHGEPGAPEEPFVERRHDPFADHTPSARPDDPRWIHAATPAPPLAERPSADPRHMPPPPQPRFVERPSVDAPPPRVEQWTEPQFTPAEFPPQPLPQEPHAVAPRGITIPPWVVAAVLAGWLTIVALLLALLVDG